MWSGNSFDLKGCYETGHSRNIFCAEFVPTNLSQVVTCGADGDMRLTDIVKDQNGSLVGRFQLLAAHRGATAMKFQFLPTCLSAFLATYSTGEVKLIDLRENNRQEKLIVSMDSVCYGISFDPTRAHEFAVSSGDHLARVFDMRHSPLPFGRDRPRGCLVMYSPPELVERLGSGDEEGDEGWGFGRQRYSPTDLCFSANHELAVNYSGYDVILFDTASQPTSEGLNGTPLSTSVLQRYKGRKNSETFLKEVHFLAEDQYITTGSDSGEMFVWDKISGEVACQLQADKLIVNSIAAHPFHTTVAVSGIDSDVKVFEYCGANPFPEKRTAEQRNEGLPLSLSRRIRSDTQLDVPSLSEVSILLDKALQFKLKGDELFLEKKWKEAAR